MLLNRSKAPSNALDPCTRRVIPGNTPERVSARSRPLSRTIRLGWGIVQRASDCLTPIYRKLSKSRMRLDPSRSPPNALTPATGRVIPDLPRTALAAPLAASDAGLTARAGDYRRHRRRGQEDRKPQEDRILDRSSISSGARIVADCNDCERRSLPLEMMAARNSSISNISRSRFLTGKILDERPIALRSEAQFPPYARGRVRDFFSKG